MHEDRTKWKQKTGEYKLTEMLFSVCSLHITKG